MNDINWNFEELRARLVEAERRQHNAGVCECVVAHTCEGDNCIGCPTCARAGKYQTCGYVCGHDNGEGE